LNHRPSDAARFALTGVAFAAACLWASQAWALGLGRLTVNSSLGETLRAEIEVTSITPEEASSLQLRVAPAEAFRAAGVEYNAALPSARAEIVKRPDGRSVVRITGERAVLEPFVDVIIEATWSSGRLVREYTMLFDPPGSRTAQAPAPTTGPVMTPAPTPAPTAAAPAPAPVAAAPAPARPAARPAPIEPPRVPVAGAAPAGSGGGGEVRVKPGDSLSRIAQRTLQPGLSLDQMLVSLFRGNPQAFAGDNMNRLKSGAVLSMPSADEAAKLSPRETREIIVAQSADFAAYRQRLATGTTTEADAAATRQARGQVQTQVDDRKQAAATTPDRLRLSQGGVQASAAEARTSRETQTRADSARLAELARNVEELKKLQGATAPAGPAPAAPAAPAAAQAPAMPAPTVVAAAPPPAPAPATTAAPAPAPTAAPAPAPTAAPAPAPTAAPAPDAKPAAKPAAPAAEEPGLLDSLLDNSLLLPGAGVLVALLAGLGLYRLRGRRKQAGETSFLESRLQPDSFFGASGGQRIDTRDAPASANSSSMNYSLSQLDAIGDVDPVAEADVYLAYGRDLQAEEILKEAMRATPERMAIRTKLLEVYAKRRDNKAFELLATQLFNLTHGEGEDWKKAQELGQGIDPTNELYRPGGQPEDVRAAGGVMMPDALGASTQPYTAPVQPPAFQPAADATLDARNDGSLDLDLELEMPARGSLPVSAPMPFAESTQAMGTNVQMGSDETLDLTLETPGDPKTIPVARPAEPADDHSLDFDLGALANEPPTIAIKTPAHAPAVASGFDFGEFSIGGEPLTAQPAADDANDPLSRKLELAEEFRQIGDLEGARDLLEEVVAKGSGPLQAKAQGMLDKLA